MRLRFALALWLIAAPSSPEIDVALRGDRVAVRAVGAPLAEVLSRFAQATGTEVVYEAARPRQLVSVRIEAGSATEALAQLLEGQGLNYALRLDPSGRKVEMLVVTGSAGTTVASAPAGGRPTPPPEPDFADESEAGLSEEAPPFLPDAPEAWPSSEPAGDLETPSPVMPGSWPGAPGGATGVPPSAAGSPGYLSETSQPQPPYPASYPGSPAPARPVYPVPVSYPPGG